METHAAEDVTNNISSFRIFNESQYGVAKNKSMGKYIIFSLISFIVLSTMVCMWLRFIMTRGHKC